MTTTADAARTAQPDAGGARPRSVTARRVARVLGRASFVVLVLSLLVPAVVTIGAAAGRFRVLPVGARGQDVHLAASDAVVVVPVPTMRVQVGDTVLAHPQHVDHAELLRVSVVDSWTHDVVARDEHGAQFTFDAGDETWRVSRTLPGVGSVYRYLVGTFQAVLLLLAAMMLVARAAVQRRLGSDANREERRSRPAIRRPWWWTRLGSAVVAMLGVLSLTASATFTGSVSVTQGSITAGHMQLTVPAAGATNRLTLGTVNAGNAIAPGDFMYRGIDLSVDGTTTSGIISNLTVTVTAPTSSALDTSAYGLALWIEKCSSLPDTGASPTFSTPTCSGAADVLGTQASPLTITSIKGVAQTLSGLSTSASSTNHLLVYLKFLGGSGSDDSTFQDQVSALTFQFGATQRSGSAH